MKRTQLCKELMPEDICILCRRFKATEACEICQTLVCHDCRFFLEEGTFSFLPRIPAELNHSVYCQQCYSLKVESALASYQEVMDRAKRIYVFFGTQKKAIPLIRRSKEMVKVEACDDRDEAILRLAFFAAVQNYNAIIETEVSSEKIRNAGYQHKQWRGTAIPAQVDENKVERLGRK